MTPRTATLIGLTATLMWSLLSVLTVATGKIPAFQLAAMTFAIGALTGFLTWIGRPAAFARVAAAADGLDRRGRRPVRLSRAVFSGAALRAAGGSRPVELSLAALDRAVFVAVARRAAQAAPYRRRAVGARRHGAAAGRQHRRRLRAGSGARIDRGLRRGLCVGDLFGDVAQAQVACRPMRWRAFVSRPRCSRHWCMARSRPRCGPRRSCNGWRSQRSASARSAPRSMPGISE